jgi:hypothetical protein
MNVPYTQIVGVESDQVSVKIKFRPQGSDASDNPQSVTVTPHASYLHLSLSFAEFNDGGNTKSLSIGPVN